MALAPKKPLCTEAHFNGEKTSARDKASSAETLRDLRRNLTASTDSAVGEARCDTGYYESKKLAAECSVRKRLEVLAEKRQEASWLEGYR